MGHGDIFRFTSNLLTLPPSFPPLPLPTSSPLSNFIIKFFNSTPRSESIAGIGVKTAFLNYTR